MIQKKKSRLVEQLNEADILHQNTDRRASQVRQMLSKYSKDQSEFDTFLVDLIKHITDLKETEQRIQLGEEQLVALNDNLISLPWNKFISVLSIFFNISFNVRSKNKYLYQTQ